MWWGAWLPACLLLHRSCASLVPKAARKETMETMETGQEGPIRVTGGDVQLAVANLDDGEGAPS